MRTIANANSQSKLVPGVVISAPYQEVALAELPARINAEHDGVQAAMENGLEHARRAGELLLQAKSRVGHGNWTPWLEQHFKGSARTAQAYCRVAENWAQIFIKGVEGLSLNGALQLIARPVELSPPSPNPQSSADLPAPLAYYRDQDLLNDDALQHLLALREDYGPEVLCGLKSLSPDSPIPIDGLKQVWWFLNDVRPLDHPPLWLCPMPGEPDTPAIVAAVKLFFEDGRARGGRVGQWELVALWFASKAVWLAEKPGFPPDRIASVLGQNLDVWRESFRTSLVMVHMGEGFLDPEENGEDLYWAYYSDLRHAGAVREFQAMFADNDAAAYPGLWRSWLAGNDDMDRLHATIGYALPSSKQGRLDHLERVEDDEAEGALEE